MAVSTAATIAPRAPMIAPFTVSLSPDERLFDLSGDPTCGLILPSITNAAAKMPTHDGSRSSVQVV